MCRTIRLAELESAAYEALADSSEWYDPEGDLVLIERELEKMTTADLVEYVSVS